MKKINILDKYRLELIWKKVIKQDDLFVLKNAKLQGPGLSNSAKIKDKDFIDLDFTQQYLIIIPNFYIARLSWEGVRYAIGSAYLGKCTLESKNIKFVPKLRDNDMILIDLYKHEQNRHHLNLVYDSIVCNNEKYLYNFTEKKLE